MQTIEHVLTLVGILTTAATAAVPVLRALAKLTKTHVDDNAVNVLAKALDIAARFGWLRGRASKARGVPPVAIVFLVLLSTLTGCEAARKAWPTIRTIVDIALAACQAHAAANEHQLAGKTPAEWCDEADNFAPFLEAQRAASLQASRALGLSAAPPVAGDAP